MDSSLKKCSDCKTKLPLSNFGIDNSRHDKLNSKCFECREIRRKIYYENNKEAICKKARENYDPEYSAEKWKRFYISGKDRTRNVLRKAYSANRAMRYYTRKSLAMPKWLSKEQIQEIENMYWLARDLKLVSGQTYHVDHVAPLHGKDVCGLHVPWNLQVLPADLNIKKSNK